MIKLGVEIESGAIENRRVRTKAVFRAAGGEVAALTRKRLARAAGGGKLYRIRGTKDTYKASAAGEAPVKVTGGLSGAIVVSPFRSGWGVAIRDKARYANILEHGAKGGAGNAAVAPRLANGQLVPQTPPPAQKPGIAGVETPERTKLRGLKNLRDKKRVLLAVAGRRELLPRPFLEPALEERRGSIERRIQDAVRQDVRFAREKVARR